MRKTKATVYLEDLSPEELLSGILAEAKIPIEQSPDLLDLVAEDTRACLKAKTDKRSEKKARQKRERTEARSHQEDKKIAFMLEGDRLKEVKRCKQWEEMCARAERWTLQSRGMRGGGGSSSLPATAPAPIPTKYCSICKRKHR